MKNKKDVNYFYDLIVYKNIPEMTSISEIFLNKRKYRREDKIKMLNAMDNSKLHLYKVLNVDEDNAFIEGMDILTGEKFTYIDISASTNSNLKNMYLSNRFITYDDITFGTGLHFAYNMNDKKIINYLKKTKNYQVSDLVRLFDLYYLNLDSKIINFINYI